MDYTVFGKNRYNRQSDCRVRIIKLLAMQYAYYHFLIHNRSLIDQLLSFV